MVTQDNGSYHFPELIFSRAAADGNKHGKGGENCLYPSKPYFNCFIVPIQYINARLFALVGIFYEHVNLLYNGTLLCHDYAMVCHLYMNNFCRYLGKNLLYLSWPLCKINIPIHQ